MIPEHDCLCTGHGDGVPDPVVLNRQQLLRRLARLDVVRCPGDAEPVRVRSADGAAAAVRAGWWSAADVTILLAELGLSFCDFQDTR